MNSFLKTVEFNCEEAVKEYGNTCWKHSRSKIENALKGGCNVSIISSVETKGFSAARFKHIDLHDREGLLKVLTDSDSIFTNHVSEEKNHMGFTVMSKKLITQALAMAEPLFKAEIVFQREKAEAEEAEAVAAEKAEFAELMKQKARFDELSAKFGDQGEAA